MSLHTLFGSILNTPTATENERIKKELQAQINELSVYSQSKYVSNGNPEVQKTIETTLQCMNLELSVRGNDSMIKVGQELTTMDQDYLSNNEINAVINGVRKYIHQQKQNEKATKKLIKAFKKEKHQSPDENPEAFRVYVLEQKKIKPAEKHFVRLDKKVALKRGLKQGTPEYQTFLKNAMTDHIQSGETGLFNKQYADKTDRSLDWMKNVPKKLSSEDDKNKLTVMLDRINTKFLKPDEQDQFKSLAKTIKPGSQSVMLSDDEVAKLTGQIQNLDIVSHKRSLDLKLQKLGPEKDIVTVVKDKISHSDKNIQDYYSSQVYADTDVIDNVKRPNRLSQKQKKEQIY